MFFQGERFIFVSMKNLIYVLAAALLLGACRVPCDTAFKRLQVKYPDCVTIHKKDTVIKFETPEILDEGDLKLVVDTLFVKEVVMEMNDTCITKGEVKGVIINNAPRFIQADSFSVENDSFNLHVKYDKGVFTWNLKIHPQKKEVVVVTNTVEVKPKLNFSQILTYILVGLLVLIVLILLRK